ncbi:MAG: FMN-binding protein [Treponema sp.]
MKQMIKLSVTLAVYTVIACLSLAAVNMFTSPRIQAAKEEKTKIALKALFPEADTFKPITEGMPKSIDKVFFGESFLAFQGEKPIGIIVTVSGHTYDQATILNGIDMNGTLKMIQFLVLTDSPGIGTKAKEEPFIGQFRNKPVSDGFAIGGDVQAIAGATITSTAVTRMVKIAVGAASAYLKSEGLAAGGN